MESLFKLFSLYIMLEQDDSLIKNKKRSKKRLLRVTFEDGQSICYANATMTFMETLRRIGIEKLRLVDITVAHVPLVSQQLSPKHKAYQKELVKGWFVMTQSDSDEKYRQLLAVKEQLNLDINIEIGTDFEKDKVKLFSKERVTKGSLLVSFPDGEFIGRTNPIDTYKDVILKIGLKSISAKNIEFLGKPLIAFSQVTNNYVEIDKGKWLYVPGTTKEKAKCLKILGLLMRIQYDVDIID